jgi:hypothetical protein
MISTLKICDWCKYPTGAALEIWFYACIFQNCRVLSYRKHLKDLCGVQMGDVRVPMLEITCVSSKADVQQELSRFIMQSYG